MPLFSAGDKVMQGGREHPKTAARTPVLFLLSAEPPDCNTERKRAACAMFSLQTLEML